MSRPLDKAAKGGPQPARGVGEADGPHACRACGHPTMLFTPNARRDPFARPGRYEAAWQCTKCGHLEFIATES